MPCTHVGAGRSAIRADPRLIPVGTPGVPPMLPVYGIGYLGDRCRIRPLRRAVEPPDRGVVCPATHTARRPPVSAIIERNDRLPPTLCSTACQLMVVGVPAGVPTGKPSPGSIRNTPATSSPT